MVTALAAELTAACKVSVRALRQPMRDRLNRMLSQAAVTLCHGSLRRPNVGLVSAVVDFGGKLGVCGAQLLARPAHRQ